MAEALRRSPETITTLLTGYTPIQNEKLKKKTTIFLRSGILSVGNSERARLEWLSVPHDEASGGKSQRLEE